MQFCILKIENVSGTVVDILGPYEFELTAENEAIIWDSARENYDFLGRRIFHFVVRQMNEGN